MYFSVWRKILLSFLCYIKLNRYLKGMQSKETSNLSADKNVWLGQNICANNYHKYCVKWIPKLLLFSFIIDVISIFDFSIYLLITRNVLNYESNKFFHNRPLPWRRLSWNLRTALLVNPYSKTITGVESGKC